MITLSSNVVLFDFNIFKNLTLYISCKWEPNGMEKLH